MNPDRIKECFDDALITRQRLPKFRKEKSIFLQMTFHRKGTWISDCLISQLLIYERRI